MYKYTYSVNIHVCRLLIHLNDYNNGKEVLMIHDMTRGGKSNTFLLYYKQFVNK